MAMKKPPVTIPLSGRVPGRGAGPSRARVDGGGVSGTFRGFLLRYLGFPRREE